MGKDPAFLFYPNDWIGGTMGMTFEEKGAYMELLMYQFNVGHMEGHMVGRIVGQLWDNIKHKFKQDDAGLWYNDRLEIEKERRKSFTDSRKNNLKGINQHTKKQGHKGGHMTKHMENENESINKDKGKTTKGGMGESKKYEYPSHAEFMDFVKEKTGNEYQAVEKAARLKYEAWAANDWKNGNDKKIKNWKSTILNTLPHLKRETITIQHNERPEDYYAGSRRVN